MNHKETELLDDLDAWRKSRVLRFGTNGNSVINDADSHSSCIVYVSTGKYSRQDIEPEMVEAVKKVKEAIAGLEPARQKIVERKLYELRLAGMRAPSEGEV